MPNTLTDVYISYVKTDEKYLDQLLRHFSQLKNIRVRSQKDISPGLPTLSEVKLRIDASEFAVLLLSSSYIASPEFERDWSFLQSTNPSPKREIIPLYVGFCNLFTHPLSQLTTLNNPNQPISSLDSTERDKTWVNLVSMIYQISQNLNQPLQPFNPSTQNTVNTTQPSQENITMQDDEEDLELTGTIYEELVAALNSAFPNRAALERLASFELGQNLNVIVGDGNLEYVAFSLVGWAESHGKLKVLIRGASARNPHNRLLKVFVKRYL